MSDIKLKYKWVQQNHCLKHEFFTYKGIIEKHEDELKGEKGISIVLLGGYHVRLF